MERKKRKPAVALPVLRLDSCDPVPLFKQIASRIRILIEANDLVSGDRLPSIRTLAGQLGVSPDTVVAAYQLLVDEGWIDNRRGSGHTVADNPLPAPGPKQMTPQKPRAPLPLGDRAQTALEAIQSYHPSDYRSRPFVLYGETMGQIADPEWMKLSSHLSRAPWVKSGWGDPAGDRNLRTVIAERLRQYRGIACDPAQVIVTSGMVHNLSIAAGTLFNRDDTVCIESPSPCIFSHALRFQGVRVRLVDVDREGLLVHGPRGLDAMPGVRGIALSPSSQVPLSVTMPAARREELLGWAAENRCWVLEDGMEDFAWLRGQAIPNLYACGKAPGQVVYMDSFTLQVFPGIRCGYLVVPEQLADAFAGACYLTNRFSSEYWQAVLCQYLSSASYDSYVRKLIKMFRTNREAFEAEACRLLAPYGELVLGDCGVHATLHLDRIPDTVAAQALERADVTVYPLSRFNAGAKPGNGLVLGFGQANPASIRSALSRTASVLETLAKQDHGASP